ncbi:glutathione binding-like protein [Thalassospira marina]|uniref:Glutathione S-transferase n=1 Tax=Thalassospira marina TaxID=2048283 RepID=A0A2N3KV70_9PROT|nr:glutathione binding-like protein [Thalassospira marina]PKR54444.1 glutathione S-transferase [Thalassospira marina]
MIDLFTFGTPNGRKVSILFEELEADYTLHVVDISKGEQFAPEFLAISPNNRIPAIVDSDGPGGKKIEIFESGAILIYLAEKFGKFIPADPHARIECLKWLMWQMGGFGPMLGQAHHFLRAAKEDVPYGKERYVTEAKRLYGVLDGHLAKSHFLAGDEYSIADMACYPWACRHEWHQVDLANYPHVSRWKDEIAKRPAVARGMVVPNDR